MGRVQKHIRDGEAVLKPQAYFEARVAFWDFGCCYGSPNASETLSAAPLNRFVKGERVAATDAVPPFEFPGVAMKLTIGNEF